MWRNLKNNWEKLNKLNKIKINKSQNYKIRQNRFGVEEDKMKVKD